jgi:hypothetical protein
VACFKAVAGLPGSIYAAVGVERGHTINRGRVGGTAMSETGPFPRADVWTGLPPSPTWLAWFGRPYAAAVRGAVDAHIAEDGESGLLVRMSRQPLNADELAAIFPPLPARLLARRVGEPGTWMPGIRYSLVNGAPSHAAEEIPPLREDL